MLFTAHSHETWQGLHKQQKVTFKGKKNKKEVPLVEYHKRNDEARHKNMREKSDL